MHVVGMYSPEKEYVKFNSSIDVNDGERKGNVEIWLLDIENLMRETLRGISKKSVIFYCLILIYSLFIDNGRRYSA